MSFPFNLGMYLILPLCRFLCQCWMRALDEVSCLKNRSCRCVHLESNESILFFEDEVATRQKNNRLHHTAQTLPLESTTYPVVTLENFFIQSDISATICICVLVNTFSVNTKCFSIRLIKGIGNCW